MSLVKLKERIPPDDLVQLAISDADLESLLASAAQIVTGYCVAEGVKDELTIKVALYNTYLKGTTQMPETMTEDYKQTLKILESLKNTGLAQSTDSFVPKYTAKERINIDGF